MEGKECGCEEEKAGWFSNIMGVLKECGTGSIGLEPWGKSKDAAPRKT